MPARSHLALFALFALLLFRGGAGWLLAAPDSGGGVLFPLKEEEARAKEGGASGYLPKDVDLDRLSAAIREIAAKDGVFAHEEFQSAPSPLTAREMDVLKLVAQGRQRDQIAAELGIGSESVKTDMKGMMTKLGCPNATSVVGRAYELGILRA